MGRVAGQGLENQRLRCLELSGVTGRRRDVPMTASLGQGCRGGRGGALHDEGGIGRAGTVTASNQPPELTPKSGAQEPVRYTAAMPQQPPTRGRPSPGQRPVAPSRPTTTGRC
jgi:hypothetical protein